ncbi:hypothetical protein A3A21_01065 [Candidatus Jorgensenbacteria bacterium RIFCSPLOWO2_01_FULL_45_25b]|uniref:Peptidase M50 domain-containing protein n=1 Tax=Candidatus Jorgensenbacteria bacterium RIFCSPLOWO2_01_FULL_45_25b TaxID=1798471 RepID=A0A1F6BV30_9BACT|nr:MAG: hypothetical protein A3A21_01065 [Candidatus Jorgensenbacteria bacterium RIFCSPLOWO2_01_FULL_45_25b]
MEGVFIAIVFIFSVVIHEVSHGVVADKLGDPTARLLGRLTLNPLKHIDPFGSIILPALLIISRVGFVFGWAKPVPYNPYHLKKPERDAAIIAGAGPASNLLVALIFALIIWGGTALLPNVPTLLSVLPLFALIVQINIVLAVFNLVPIPPLDGSKILFLGLRGRWGESVRRVLEQYGSILLIFFIFFGYGLITPIIHVLMKLLI